MVTQEQQLAYNMLVDWAESIDYAVLPEGTSNTVPPELVLLVRPYTQKADGKGRFLFIDENGTIRTGENEIVSHPSDLRRVVYHND